MSLSIFAAAEESPDRLALVSAAGVRLTYEQLADRVAALIPGLEAAGLDGSAPLPRVALAATNSLETICFILALVELGEPFVPLHPRLTERERSAILDEVRPLLVLDRDAYGAFAAPPGARMQRAIPEERCLAVVYTSGTSGRSKGAMLSRRAFAASAEASAENLGWTEADRWLACLPLAHVGALSVVTRCLLARRTIVLEEAGAGDVELLAATMAREEVTLASLVPTLLSRLFALTPAWAPPPSLRAILLGGAGARAPLLEEARRRQVPVLTTYGLTEACSQVTTQRYGTPPAPGEGSGEPLRKFEVRIAGGEIQVRSAALMSGYFPPGVHPDPFLPDGFLRTGDLGRFDERGRLHVLTRRTDLIVTGGENVYPAEVEQVLLELPGVRAACVFGVEDETWGQLVAAALVAEEPPSPAAVVRHLGSALASFKHPRMIAFVGELPATASGKVDRTAARRLAEPLLVPLERTADPSG